MFLKTFSNELIESSETNKLNEKRIGTINQPFKIPKPIRHSVLDKIDVNNPVVIKRVENKKIKGILLSLSTTYFLLKNRIKRKVRIANNSNKFVGMFKIVTFIRYEGISRIVNNARFLD